jgi:glycerol-3-phosphate acyltransferase PlsY
MRQIISAIFIGYLFGCFQTSYFISKKFGKKDIREIGTGNAGASNITSEMGWKFGIITGVSDVLKAFIPAKLIVLIFPYSYQPVELMAIAGVGAVLGHIYPFFMGFRGGKGVACYIGMMLAIDWKIGVAAIIFLIVLTIITDYVSIASILLYVIVSCLAYYSENYSDTIIVCTLFILVIGIYKHWVNIQNLFAGNEKGLRSVFKKNR